MRRWLYLILICCPLFGNAQKYVQKQGTKLFLNGRPYYYVGTNYWYGTVLGLHADSTKGINRLRKELDLLKSLGITNLRVMAGAEGSGIVNGVERVGPSLQPEKGKFDTAVLKGLDILLAEMRNRNMKAVIFFSNNWEWSGGFLQYLRWNNAIPDSMFRKRMSWDELRDAVSLFYTCEPCKQDYLKTVGFVLGRVNSINGVAYDRDPTIMTWEIANEPRPMRPASNEAYAKWISDVASFIRARDGAHLITTGHEGEIGTESLELFERIHNDRNIDYLTIHIWPRNWGWYPRDSIVKGFGNVLIKTKDYIDKHIGVAKKLNKPLVIEEFGFPRDNNSFNPKSSTQFRDQYYRFIITQWNAQRKRGGPLVGLNFWVFNGTARPIAGQTFWKRGDEYMGDPPMEEQGLYGVFDSDWSTLKILEAAAKGKY